MLDVHTHIPTHKPKPFQEIRCMPASNWCMPEQPNGIDWQIFSLQVTKCSLFLMAMHSH